MPDTKPDEASAIDKIWELANKLDPCLLVTRDGDWQRVRPVYARARRDEGRIYILTDTSGEKHEQIERFPQVSLAFADPLANDYVVINGSPRSPEIARRSRRSGNSPTKRSGKRPTIRSCASSQSNHVTRSCGTAATSS